MRQVQHVRGDTWRKTWIVKNSAGALVDLTGASARCQLRATDGTLAVSATSAPGGGLTITAASGRIDLDVSAATMILTPGFYYYDIELTEADGRRTTLEQVRMQLLEDYSHD